MNPIRARRRMLDDRAALFNPESRGFRSESPPRSGTYLVKELINAAEPPDSVFS